MPRTLRLDYGDIVYHVLNRATARLTIFEQDDDYWLFINTLKEAKEKYPMRLLSYCIMPNHWHLVLHPEEDGQLIPFMRWLSMTHTHRWHAVNKTIGSGHLYQGRYKSFPVQTDEHFLQLVRYVERNPLRAKLVKKAQNWHWSSLHLRQNGSTKEKKLLDPWPVPVPRKYLEWVNQPQNQEEVEVIRMSISKGRPFGQEDWTYSMADRLQLNSAFRERGRPKNT